MQFKRSFLPTALNPFTFPLNSWMKIGLTLVLVSFPFQLNSFVFQMEWGKGFTNPYLSIFFGLTDLFLLLTATLFFVVGKKQHVKIHGGSPLYFLLVLFCLALVLVPLSVSEGDGLFNFFLIIKIFELLLFYLLVVNKILSTQEILRIFIYSMTLQALLALSQLIFQSDLGLQVLGEPQISAENPHLARFSFLSMDILRAYGTFPHPNILGGFLCMSILSTFLIQSRFKHEWTFLFTIQLLGLFATFSRSAILGLSFALILLGFWYFKKLKEKRNLVFMTLIALFLIELSALLFMRGFYFFKDSAFLERWEGYKLSFELFSSHPWGLGFGRYTLMMGEGSGVALMPWEYQPVHNAFLLALVETGTQGFLLAILVLGFSLYSLYKRRNDFLSHRKQLRRQVFFAIVLAFLVLSSFDHYLISLEQGRLLVLLFFSLASLFAYEALPVYKIRTEAPQSKIQVDLE